MTLFNMFHTNWDNIIRLRVACLHKITGFLKSLFSSVWNFRIGWEKLIQETMIDEEDWFVGTIQSWGNCFGSYCINASFNFLQKTFFHDSWIAFWHWIELCFWNGGTDETHFSIEIGTPFEHTFFGWGKRFFGTPLLQHFCLDILLTHQVIPLDNSVLNFLFGTLHIVNYSIWQSLFPSIRTHNFLSSEQNNHWNNSQFLLVSELNYSLTRTWDRIFKFVSLRQI